MVEGFLVLYQSNGRRFLGFYISLMVVDFYVSLMVKVSRFLHQSNGGRFLGSTSV